MGMVEVAPGSPVQPLPAAVDTVSMSFACTALTSR